MHAIRLSLLCAVMLLVAACGGSESAISYGDLPQTGDAARGETLYTTSVGVMPACIGCHVEGAAGAPSLQGYAADAANRVEGQDAHEYTFYAIADPGRFIVEGYGNAMYNRYDDNLTPQDMADLIAYLLEDERFQ